MSTSIALCELAVITTATTLTEHHQAWVETAARKRSPDHQVAAAWERVHLGLADLAADVRALQHAQADQGAGS